MIDERSECDGRTYQFGYVAAGDTEMGSGVSESVEGEGVMFDGLMFDG